MSGLPTTVRRHLPGWRADSPEAFLVDGRRSDTHTLVACVGDSITQGQLSANYVDLLKQRWEPAGIQFVNAGVNGDLAYNVARRLDTIIVCQPDVVTLLVGTNDVNAGFDQKWRRRYERNQHLPVPPTLAWYEDHVGAILTRLRAETDARIAVLDVPPLGEDLASRMNGLVGISNAALRKVAAAHSVPCLALHDGLVQLLPSDHVPPPYEGEVAAVMKAGIGHLLLRRSWDDISRRNGLALLTDHIHLNDRAAAVVADLIGGLLEENPTDWATFGRRAPFRSPPHVWFS